MIVIDVTARISKIEGPLKRANDLVQKLEKSMDRLTKATEKWAAVMASVQVPSAGGGRSGGGGGGRATGPGLRQPSQATPMDVFRMLNALVGKGPSPLRPARDAALQKAFSYYSNLAKQGNPVGMRAVASLAPHMNSLLNPNAPPVIKPPKKPPVVKGKKTFGQLALNALMSTRVGFGQDGISVMPLVGRTIQALAAMGPPGIAAAAALTAVASASALVVNAMNSIAAWTTKMNAAGTTPQTQGVLDRMRFLGVDPGSFAAAISSGDGAAFAGKFGISPYSGVWGDFDVGKKILKYAKGIAQETTLQGAQQAALAAHQPGLANIWYLSPENKKDMLKGNAYSERDMRNAVNGAYAMNKLQDAFEKFVNKVAVDYGPTLIRVAQMLAASIGPLATLLRVMPDWTKGAAYNMPDIVSPADKANKGIEGALDENTQAVRDNTRAVKGMRDVIGGPRTQGVLRPGIRGEHLSDPSYREGLEGGIV